MYDELIKRLRNCATQAAPCRTCDMIEDGSCSDTLMKQAADAIEELAGFVQEAERDRDEYRERLYKTNGLMQKQWIPVSERLPEHDKNVLICYERTGRSRTVYREVGIASIEELERDPTEMFRPLYWMPLPSTEGLYEGERR